MGDKNHGGDARAAASESTAGLPQAEIVVRKRGISLAWIWPVLALALAGWLGWGAMQARGPVINIRFAQGAGIEPGDPLTYRGLDVGAVREVRLSPGLGSVVVEAELKPHAAGLAREGAKFWIVRPSVSLRRVSGLETLIGPRYIR
ncbi:MAG: MlaD family protein, partial [Phycisphaerales bacterium JB039]